MSDEFTSEGVDQEKLLGKSIEISARKATLRSHVIRNFEADAHYKPLVFECHL